MTAPNSPPFVPDPDLESYILDRIDYRAKGLAMRFELTDQDRDEYRHDMVVEVYQALQRFDPSRSKPQTFVCRVLRRYVRYLIRARQNNMRRSCTNPLGFEDIGQNFEPPVNDPPCGERSETDRVALRLDMDQAIASMPADMSRAARLLMHFSAKDTAEQMGVNIGTVYRMKKRIGRHLIDAGVIDFQSAREKNGPTADVVFAGKGEQR